MTANFLKMLVTINNRVNENIASPLELFVMKKWVTFVILFILVFIFIFDCFSPTGVIQKENLCAASKISPSPQRPLKKIKMTVGRTVVTVEVARTDEEKEQGLSWRKSLKMSEGMMFVYVAPEKPTFWMYGMQFSLDFIWICNNKVIDFTENVPAPLGKNKEPIMIQPKKPVDKVLEVPAGFVKKNRIKIGDKVKF